MKPNFEQLLMLYRRWLENPVGTQSAFFAIYKWSEDEFFLEAMKRGINV